MKDRCFLVFALAPESTDAREANDRLNAYIERYWWQRRGG